MTVRQNPNHRDDYRQFLSITTRYTGYGSNKDEAIPGCKLKSRLLIDDQIAITEQVVENLLIGKRTVCGEVNTT